MDINNIKFNIDTKFVLNIGDPIEKTNAPRVYNKLFSLLNMNAIMIPVKIKKGDLPRLMDACRTLGIRYICPTMPHKADIIPLIDDVDEISRMFNSVNAVYIDDNGISHGVGMDGKGAVSALLDSGIDLKEKTAVILGTGSISGVICHELSKHGVKKLFLLNRTEKRLKQISDILTKNTDCEIVPLLLNPDNLDRAAEEANIFLNCTPLGMAGYKYTHEYLGFVKKLPSNAFVFDCIINPPDTPLISEAKKRHLKIVPGMKMLAGQMDAIFNFMFGIKLTSQHKEACIEELKVHLGIVEE
jgi:shikimate dehydrogenase